MAHTTRDEKYGGFGSGSEFLQQNAVCEDVIINTLYTLQMRGVQIDNIRKNVTSEEFD